jgi:hypothetical protein
MNLASGVYVMSKRSGDGWRPVAKFMVPDLGEIKSIPSGIFSRDYEFGSMSSMYFLF